jgi:hypothetical protein
LIRPLSVASRGHLRSGDTPTLTIAVRGFLDGAAIVPPIPEQRPPGGGSKKRRREAVRAKIVTLRDQIERARKAKDAQRVEAGRVEALEIAEAEGLKTEALRQADSTKEVVAAVRALTKQINAEIAVVRRNTEDSRKAREQAIRDEQEKQRADAERAEADRKARFASIITAEEERQAALLAENEEIAMALLLVA